VRPTEEAAVAAVVVVDLGKLPLVAVAERPIALALGPLGPLAHRQRRTQDLAVEEAELEALVHRAEPEAMGVTEAVDGSGLSTPAHRRCSHDHDG